MAKVLQKSLREIVARELAGEIREIPTLPIIYQKLFKKMQDPDVSVPEIANLIANDQALASKVLHLVNSAFYGYKQQIKTVSRAVVILGFRAVRSAALAISVFEYFKNEESTDSIDMAKFWEHSIATACIAKVLAAQNKIHQEEEAFLVGLLHDVGKLIEKRYFPEDFGEIHATALRDSLPWYDAEKSLFQVNHASIGKTVFRSWDFPVSMVEAIQLHHMPRAAARFPELAALVHIADFISYQIDYGAPGSGSPANFEPSALALLGLDMTMIQDLQPQIMDELQPALEILKLIE